MNAGSLAALCPREPAIPASLSGTRYFFTVVGAVGSVGFTGVRGADSGGMVGGVPGRIGSGFVGSPGRTPGAGEGGVSGVAVWLTFPFFDLVLPVLPVDLLESVFVVSVRRVRGLSSADFDSVLLCAPVVVDFGCSCAPSSSPVAANTPLKRNRIFTSAGLNAIQSPWCGQALSWAEVNRPAERALVAVDHTWGFSLISS